MASSGDIYGTALSGLRSFQRAIQTTSHNISNSSTEGYNRQRVDLATRQPIEIGNQFIGSGVQVAGNHRLADQFLISRELHYSSGYNYASNFYNFASQADELLANEQANINTSIQGFFNGVQQVTDYPSSLAAREVMLSEGEMMSERFQAVFEQLESYRYQINNAMDVTTKDLNMIAQQIADLNDEIVTQGGTGTAFPPNDLMDRRDMLVKKLAEIVNVTTTQTSSGALNVFIGKGQSLVLDSNANQLAVTDNIYDPLQKEISYVGSNNTTVGITDLITGGRLGGLLAARDEMVNGVTNSLGRVAIGLAYEMNTQHRNGMDLDGDINQPFFKEPQPVVFGGMTNTGTGMIGASITDISKLTTADYEVVYNGTNYVMRNMDTKATTVIPGGGPFPYDTGAGFDFDITTAGAVAGDRFLIRPTYVGASDIGVAITSPRDIAASAPVRVDADLANGGTVEAGNVQVTDITDANILNSVRIQFTSLSPDQYDVFDITTSTVLASNVPYTSGDPISYNGWQIELSGAPQLGDTFVVENAFGSGGDNSNALLMADLQEKNILENNTGTFQEVYGSLVASVGVQTNQADQTAKAQQSLLGQAQEAIQSVSGVNLDEEAANLMQYQQAYSAAARVMTTANQMFQSLLDAFR